MTDVGFIVGSYLVVFGGLTAYAVRLVRMGRGLTREVPADRRRWGQ